MARFVVATQYRENYGAHNWDGTGVCPQFWKNKGGDEYVVDVADNVLEAMSDVAVAKLFETMRTTVSYDNEHATEHVIWHGIVPSGCRTSLETEFDGMLANNIVSESDRKYYAPKVLTQLSVSWADL